MELEKFVDPMPIMKTAIPKKTSKDGDYYEIDMKEFSQKLHRDLNPTRLWGYDGQFPGPTIEVMRGKPARIKWMNNLPDTHFLPIDRSIHHVAHEPEVRTVVHLHGSETTPASDGYPEAWFTKDFAEVGSFFEQETYEYPNDQRAATLWYHDHAMGITRLNVYAGLSGLYIIRDPREERLNLPKGEFDIPLLIQDRSFNDDGSLFYPAQPANPAPNLPNPSVLPFFVGNTILVNGKVWPYLQVEPRKYRFRILNGSNSRSYQLALDSEAPFYQIASDGGLLRRTVSLQAFDIRPAERIEVIIDFSKFEGQTITLKNNASTDATADVMQFQVVLPLSGEDTSIIPKNLSYIPSLQQNEVKRIRNLKLSGTTDEYGRPLLLLNNKLWSDPVEEKPCLGTTEIWSFVNVTNVPHPMHIHLVQFQLLDHRAFNVELYNENGQIELVGPTIPPKINERGWKDTITAPAGQITRVIARFAPFSGYYVWHCHILEHEDYDMMRPFVVIDPKTEKEGR
ncbi:multicopper oxidase family protein [Shouchella clausii]|uniref:Copper oxidase n=1 Tax=Shouchella clausii TaxID=79880 RepID=A0A268S2Z9_SHOCL|nr:multicopper oxidase [Shouchella clausii]PAD15764.1 copper oxidase [Shouchella clausii]PAD41901.1 copper oxidase [Bacillus sp. 7520-S]PAF26869.1 copper oxidase [Shouchella clausii]